VDGMDGQGDVASLTRKTSFQAQDASSRPKLKLSSSRRESRLLAFIACLLTKTNKCPWLLRGVATLDHYGMSRERPPKGHEHGNKLHEV